MLRERIISGLLLGGLVVLMILIGGWPYHLALFGMLGVGLLEFRDLFARRGHKTSLIIMIGWAGLFMVSQIVTVSSELMGAGITVLLLVSVGWALARYGQGQETAFIEFALTLAGAFYVGWTGSHLSGLRTLSEGLSWTAAVVLVTVSSDVAAYFGGSLLGQRVIAPRISPKKTWEGYISGIAAGVAAGGALAWGWQLIGIGPTVSIIHGPLLGLLIAATSPLGDLTISIIKRYADAKDSSSLIPGHGGLLDRLDTQLIGSVLGYYYIILFVNT